jgi:hypothetical protein
MYTPSRKSTQPVVWKTVHANRNIAGLNISTYIIIIGNTKSTNSELGIEPHLYLLILYGKMN